ncbi:MAG: hypothetical protein JNL74_12635, partial [Fibrobacteres bacterium]|nr:hypothetical protein [Fibrobacterota bacterium]
STANGTYKAGDVINVTVNFNENVTLAGGNLLVTLETGATDRVVTIAPFASASSASGTYTVQADDATLDLTANGPLALSAGTLVDGAGNAVTLTIPAGQNIADAKAIVVDGVIPFVSSISSSTGDGLKKVGDVVNITVNFSEAVTLAGGNIEVTLETGATDRVVTIAPFASATSATGTYTVQAGDASLDLNVNGPVALSAGTLVDAAGNTTILTIPAGQNLADAKAIVIDGVIPTITSVTSSSTNGLYKYGDTVKVNVNFSEAVTLAGGNIEITLETGANDRVVTIAPFASSTSVEGFYVVQLNDESTDLTAYSPVVLSAGTLVDAAGNSSTLTIPAGQNIADLKNILVDGWAPTITSVTSTSGNGKYKLGDVVNVTVNFSENVTLSGGNLLVTLETGTVDQVVTIAPFGPANSATGSYTVQTGDVSGDLAAKTPLSLSAGTLLDASGNPGIFDIPAGQNISDLKDIAIDGVVPTVVSVTSTSGDGIYKVGDVINVKVNFSEKVELTGGDMTVTLETGTTDRTVAISPFAYSNTASGTYTVQAGDESLDLTAVSPIAVDVTLLDSAGNATTLTIPAGQNIADAKAIVVDGVIPYVASITSSTSDGLKKVGDVVNVTVNFSEAVTLAGGNIEVTLETGATDRVVTIAPFASATSATGTYTVQAGDASLDLTVNGPVALSAGTVVDAAGNSTTLTIPAGQNLADSKAIVVDGIKPVPGSIFVTDVADYTSDSTPDMSISASGADSMAFKFNGNAWSAWTAYSTFYSDFDISEGGDGLKRIYVKFRDLAGNETDGLLFDSTNYDTGAPTFPTIAVADNQDYTNSSTPLLTLSAGAADSMRFNINGGAWTAWEPYATSKNNLNVAAGGEVLKKIYVQYKDVPGNISNTAMDSVYYDISAPTLPTIAITDNQGFTADSTPVLTLSAA